MYRSLVIVRHLLIHAQMQAGFLPQKHRRIISLIAHEHLVAGVDNLPVFFSLTPDIRHRMIITDNLTLLGLCCNGFIKILHGLRQAAFFSSAKKNRRLRRTDSVIGIPQSCQAPLRLLGSVRLQLEDLLQPRLQMLKRILIFIHGEINPAFQIMIIQHMLLIRSEGIKNRQRILKLHILIIAPAKVHQSLLIKLSGRLQRFQLLDHEHIGVHQIFHQPLILRTVLQQIKDNLPGLPVRSVMNQFLRLPTSGGGRIRVMLQKPVIDAPQLLPASLHLKKLPVAADNALLVRIGSAQTDENLSRLVFLSFIKENPRLLDLSIRVIHRKCSEVRELLLRLIHHPQIRELAEPVIRFDIAVKIIAFPAFKQIIVENPLVLRRLAQIIHEILREPFGERPPVSADIKRPVNTFPHFRRKMKMFHQKGEKGPAHLFLRLQIHADRIVKKSFPLLRAYSAKERSIDLSAAIHKLL